MWCSIQSAAGRRFTRNCQGFSDPTVMKWNIAKVAFYVNRFRALPRAERLFRDVEAGTFLERPLFGYRYVCDVSRTGPQKLLYLVGERIISEANLVRSLLTPGMTIVDVGANVGYYALMF